MSWERADILQPATYAPLLKGADFVVHSMGILLEADYKKAVSGQESPFSALQRAISPPSRRRPRPRSPEGVGSDAKEDSSRSAQSTKDAQLTYEVMNRDSAIFVARAASEPDSKVTAMAYISAAGGAPVLPRRYIETKREAEDAIATGFPRLRSIFVRAPMMYDASRPLTMGLAAATGLGAAFNSVTRGVLGGFLGAAGVKPLKADVVAEAVVEALDDEKSTGVLEVPQMEELATRAWRKTML